MTTVWMIAAVMLVAAAALTTFRILAGPSTLDRLVGVDTLVAVAMCGSGHVGGVQPGLHRRLRNHGAVV